MIADFLHMMFGPDPEVGQKWILSSDIGNPFRDYHYIIIDVRQGWVRYRLVYPDGTTSSSHTKKVRGFRMYLRPLEES